MLFLTDTMVGNRNEPRPNIMPGRLKVVTIGPRVTVAFAGNADAAGLAIQAARRLLLHRGLAAASEFLKAESIDSGTDFLIASHDPEARLVRVRSGVALEVKDICSLGDDGPFKDMIEQARPVTDDLPLGRSELRHRFFDRLMTNKNLSPVVGGFPIAVIASPAGHRYLSGSGVYTYKFPDIEWGKETHQSIEQVYSGDGHFELSIVPSEHLDVPVVGVCLLQARTGYVYSPIEDPEAFRVTLAPHDEPWAGQQQRMHGILKQAVADHAAAVVTSGEQRRVEPAERIDAT